VCRSCIRTTAGLNWTAVEQHHTGCSSTFPKMCPICPRLTYLSLMPLPCLLTTHWVYYRDIPFFLYKKRSHFLPEPSRFHPHFHFFLLCSLNVVLSINPMVWARYWTNCGGRSATVNASILTVLASGCAGFNIYPVLIKIHGLSSELLAL
jgi:hypothetical protein